MASLLTLRRALAPSTALRISSHPLRTLSTTSALRAADGNRPSPFASGPAPPRLPKEEQEIFEQLQRESTGAFSTPRTPPKINQSPDSEPTSEELKSSTADGDEGGELHRDIRTGVKPEFQGEKNPKTGEIGGPKNEPLRWGAGGDWSYGGRVTDF